MAKTNKIELQRKFVEEMRKIGCHNCKELVEIIDERETWLRTGIQYQNKLKDEIRKQKNYIGELELKELKRGSF